MNRYNETPETSQTPGTDLPAGQDNLNQQQAAVDAAGHVNPGGNSPSSHGSLFNSPAPSRENSRSPSQDAQIAEQSAEATQHLDIAPPQQLQDRAAEPPSFGAEQPVGSDGAGKEGSVHSSQLSYDPEFGAPFRSTEQNPQEFDESWWQNVNFDNFEAPQSHGAAPLNEDGTAAAAGTGEVAYEQLPATGNEPIPAPASVPEMQAAPQTEPIDGSSVILPPGQGPAPPTIDLTNLIDPRILNQPQPPTTAQPNPIIPPQPGNMGDPATAVPVPGLPGYAPQQPLARPIGGMVDAATQTSGPGAQALQRPYPQRIELRNQLPPWGGIFTYNRAGELNPGLTLSAPEIMCFIGNNPRKERLRLIIQNAPFPLAHRYQDGLANRCRFGRCPVHGNVISPGQFRVAIDEQPEQAADRSPHIFAAVMHLWCVERFLDFPLMCLHLPIYVEDRPDYLFEGANVVRLGTERCKTIARNFIVACKVRGNLSYERFTYPPPHAPRYEGTLSWRLAFQFWRDNSEWIADRIMPYKGDISRLPNFSRRGLHPSHQ